MDLNNDDKLQILIAKTRDLHERINEQISQNGFSFCSHCSNHGRYCIVVEGTTEEREKMVVISDSLKELHNVLVYLQRIRSNQKMQRDEAFARLEESRKAVIERIHRWPEKERKLEVVEEVMAFVGDGKSNEFAWNLKWKMDDRIEQRNMNWISSFIVRTTRLGLEFVVFASIYSSVRFWNSRQQNHRLQKESCKNLNSC